jgi:4-hydroxybenzoate polyprenyltransferase
MFRRNLLAVFGLAAIITGVLVFGSGREFSTNWARWLFGPMLWFVGFAMVVGWAMQLVSSIARKQQDDETNQMPKPATSGR